MKAVRKTDSLLVGDVTDENQIIFRIPYAGSSIEFLFIYHRDFPDSPPDFLCVSEDFPYPPDAYTKITQSWDTDDKNCLANLFEELLAFYKLHQVSDRMLHLETWKSSSCLAFEG